MPPIREGKIHLERVSDGQSMTLPSTMTSKGINRNYQRTLTSVTGFSGSVKTSPTVVKLTPFIVEGIFFDRDENVLRERLSDLEAFLFDEKVKVRFNGASDDRFLIAEMEDFSPLWSSNPLYRTLVISFIADDPLFQSEVQTFQSPFQNSGFSFSVTNSGNYVSNIELQIDANETLSTLVFRNITTGEQLAMNQDLSPGEILTFDSSIWSFKISGSKAASRLTNESLLNSMVLAPGDNALEITFSSLLSVNSLITLKYRSRWFQ